MSEAIGARALRRPEKMAFGAAASTILVVCLYTLLLGLLSKSPCVIGTAPTSRCYSDVQALWAQRSLVSHALPYVHGGVTTGLSGGIPTMVFTGHEIEYPVLTGLFIWLTGLPAHDALSFFFFTALAIAPCALVTTLLLHRQVGRRALLFCAAPPLVWYAFLNWDLPVVATTVAGLYAWRRGRFGWCGVLLGVGVCLKGWPGLLLVPVGLDLVYRRLYRQVTRCFGAAAAVVVAVNVPFMLVNFSGWKAPFTYQAKRPLDLSSNSLWPYLFKGAKNVATANRLSEAACAVAFAAILWAGWRIAVRTGSYPVIQASAAMVASFVALGRVHSPQYALWVLPFFVLLRVRFVWWLVFVVTDAWLFSQWTVLTFWPPLLRSAVLLSDLFLLAFAVQAMRSEPAHLPDHEAGMVGDTAVADLPDTFAEADVLAGTVVAGARLTAP